MAAGLFDDLADEIKAEEAEAKSQTKKTAPKTRTKARAPKTQASTPAKEKQSELQRGPGRPRTAQNRSVFTIKPLTTTKQRLQATALAHGTTASDLVDRLTELYLDKLERKL